ncbi:bifunctional diaminohydroxyphosphoribosylaminopyrimidine deaminase/5-amino-6-(5-phosphoribosylamino)uracil reductase RibD [Polaribacter gochangensis]|uniref:bifunctional diaminohydroxyphosphoribosylaminopyrimidine deaminase/5-amino-6-(5-phosphoribosylamino)uracil reductase RibD n=1 Tax=Polaribacter gochangensis TaxID=3252903 RepID=UPI0039047A68
MSQHEKYMQRCLQIAKNGIGFTRPNPSVGAVVVLDNKIIGEGFTSVYGGNHAEVNAINSVKDKSVLKEATMYVTLEPCSHVGKTPPCADLIVKHQFKKVVIGCVDTNSLVAGKGIERLKNAGIHVVVGVLENECKEHHKRFFTVQNKKRPFIVLKWAETNNGFIAPVYPELVSGTNKKMLKQVQHKSPIWISNQYSQQLVHQWRSEEHAILVGTNTVIADNPKLNLRSWSGNNPIRIVMDRNLRIPNNASVFDGSVQTIVLIEKREDRKEESVNIVFEEIDFTKNIAKQICDVLHKHHIQSVIIEGGTQTLQTFIDENLWDEARVFIGENEFEKGVKSPGIKGTLIEEINIKKDVLKIYRND